MIIKVCGLSDNQSGRTIAQQKEVSFLGFIFYEKSPRFTSTTVNTSKKKIGVFVNEELPIILNLVKTHQLSGIQLHGNEPPEFVSQLPSDLLKIKAFGISNVADLEKTAEYDGLVDYFLFDTKSNEFGGSGKTFDWKILEDYHGNTPFILSGGIGLETAHLLDSFQHPKLVGFDLNSRFERSPKDKNVTQIQQFIRAVL